jgi:hypothetical protein
MGVNMSQLLPGVSIFLLLFLPLYIPIAVTVVNAIGNWRANRTVIGQTIDLRLQRPVLDKAAE